MVLLFWSIFNPANNANANITPIINIIQSVNDNAINVDVIQAKWNERQGLHSNALNWNTLNLDILYFVSVRKYPNR